ncbi:hypothetical protein F2Q69_00047811 [Brassica cretica]|uniref:Uncharacterized protein n=1 Tax=Brassica cretica TaxID=69181 RepID=A0A8S9PNQ7_BRACR|nr:hypothetical protein F2Q69_00047811 [Brassica cretica]
MYEGDIDEVQMLSHLWQLSPHHQNKNKKLVRSCVQTESSLRCQAETSPRAFFHGQILLFNGPHCLKLRQPLPLNRRLLTTCLRCFNTRGQLVPSSASEVLLSVA